MSYRLGKVFPLVSCLVKTLNKHRSIITQVAPNSKTMKLLFSAACVFCWDKQRITDNEMKRLVDEFAQLTRRINSSGRLHIPCSLSVSATSEKKNAFYSESLFNEGWELVIFRENIQVWRKPFQDSSLYQYKVLGSFNDIPARTFLQVQMDTDYRKKWDKLVVKLDIVDKEASEWNGNEDDDSGNEVLHWIMRYPFPMYNREYVYVRRSKVDYRNNLVVLISKSIDHPEVPETKECVRVHEYTSRMVIKPHKTLDDCGFDYLLTYFDDPRAAFPSQAYNWMASCGVHDFVEKVHVAALQLYTGTKSPVKRTRTVREEKANETAATLI